MEIRNVSLHDAVHLQRKNIQGTETGFPESVAAPREEADLSAKPAETTKAGEVKAPLSTIDEAGILARNVVRKDTFEVTMPGKPGTRKIITAGSDHFKSLWTRDACFASFGLLGDSEGQKTVRDILQSFFDRADKEGQLPRRQGDYDNPFLMVLSILGMKTPDPRVLDRCEYVNDLNAYQFDSTALPLILAGEYVKASGDREFLEKNYEAMNKSISWLEKMDRRQNGKLIDQPGSGDWKDITRRSGIVTYTNVLLYKAFDSMAEAGETMGDWDRARRNRACAEKVKDDINAKLWDEKLGYYKDSDRISNFSPDGNMFAVIFGVAGKEQTDRIFNKLEDFMNKSPLPYPALEGDYPDEFVPIWAKVAGVRHYHDRHIWPWQGNVLAVAAARSGRPELARRSLEKVGSQAIKDGTFYEIYQPEGKLEPVRGFWYKSEPDFLWSAGTYLWGCRELEKAGKESSGRAGTAVKPQVKPEEHEGYLIS
jgi:glycogen debranching enzyme